MRRSLSILMVPALLLILGKSARATPTPPETMVNHETQRCASVILADECMACLPAPEGWEVLGYSYEVECPADYELVEIDLVCTALKEQFCCTVRMDGDCEDMVINDRKDQCAFVDDIADCALPRGWEKRAEDVGGSEWTCPWDYEWGSVSCLSEGEGQDEPIFGICPCSGALLAGLLSVVARVLRMK